MSGATDCGDDAELGGTRCRGFLRGLDQLRDIQPHTADGGGVEQAGLATEMAVLGGAAAGFDGDDPFNFHVLAAVLEANLMGELQGRGGDGLVRQLEDFFELRLVQAFAAFEDLLAGGVQDGVGAGFMGFFCCLGGHVLDGIRAG